MTPAEIITEINKLPRGEWEKIKESVDSTPDHAPDSLSKPTMTEEEFAQHLLSIGMISRIPDMSQLGDEDDDFEPIEVLGEPLSEMIIRERR